MSQKRDFRREVKKLAREKQEADIEAKKKQRKSAAKKKRREERQREILEENERRLAAEEKKLMKNWQTKESSEDRRHITSDIYKSRGLRKRSKPNPIPRQRLKMKYAKMEKLRKKMGFRPYKQKYERGRGEYCVQINKVTSVKVNRR